MESPPNELRDGMRVERDIPVETGDELVSRVDGFRLPYVPVPVIPPGH